MEEKKYLSDEEIEKQVGNLFEYGANDLLFEKYYTDEEMDKFDCIKKCREFDENQYGIALHDISDEYFKNFRDKEAGKFIKKGIMSYFVSDPENIKKYYGISKISLDDLDDLYEYIGTNSDFVDNYEEYIKAGIKRDYGLTEEEYQNCVNGCLDGSYLDYDTNTISEDDFNKISDYYCDFVKKYRKGVITQDDIERFKTLEKEIPNGFRIYGFLNMDEEFREFVDIFEWVDLSYLEANLVDLIDYNIDANWEEFVYSEEVSKAVGLAAETTFGLSGDKMKFIAGLEHDTLDFDCMSNEDEVPLDMVYDNTISDAIKSWGLSDAAYHLDEFRTQFRPSYREFR